MLKSMAASKHLLFFHEAVITIIIVEATTSNPIYCGIAGFKNVTPNKTRYAPAIPNAIRARGVVFFDAASELPRNTPAIASNTNIIGCLLLEGWGGERST